MSDVDLEQLKQRLKQFAEERDWEQIHSPEKHQEVAYELADILVYLLRLAERLDVDLLDTVQKKMQINAAKYPAEKVRGSNKKYTEY